MSPVEELLPGVKNNQDITWDDPAGDEKLAGIISRGMAYLDDITATSLDYMAEDKPRELLMEYVRYARSNALDEFWGNYQPELLRLQIREELKQVDQEQGPVV